MIPTPNLDDRTFQDIVDEAIRLIPQYCPEWTNFNRSDPGITLIELFAWMTEMVIYRLNRVPEKNYLAFLDLMGIQRQAPQPARTVLQFELNPKADTVTVPRGTQAATRATGDRKATVFETEHDLVLVNNRIARAVSQFHDQYSDVTPYIDGRAPFELFEGVTGVDRFLYLGDDRLENFSESAILTTSFGRPGIAEPRQGDTGGGKRSFPKMLEWEYWNGERWRELSEAGIDVGYDKVAFIGPTEIEKTTINDIETYWIRGRLAEVPDAYDETELGLVQGRIEVLGEGVDPHFLYYNPQGEAHLSLDIDRNFKPLGEEPTTDNFFYIASDEAFSQPSTRIQIEVMLTDSSIVERPAASPELVLEWQYFNGKRWKPLGRTGPGHQPAKGKSRAKTNPHEFVDATGALTNNGAVSFDRPKDMAPAEVNGKTHHWVRCQVIAGSYGEKGSYELIEDRWVYRDEHPLRPPSLKLLALKFAEPDSTFSQVVAYNDFQFQDFSKQAAAEYKPWQAFQPVPEENPTLYLGFEHPLPNERVQLYFNVIDSAALRDGNRTQRKRVYVGEDTETFAEQSVVWEHWSGKEWSLLLPRDHTDNFTACGFVDFIGPKVQRKNRRYGDNLYWIRARLEMGGYDEPPVCDRIMLNAVHASNYTTFPETVLGSSQGTPNQSFFFNRGPVLPGQKMVVVETERPTEEMIAQIVSDGGKGAFREDDKGDAFYVLWKEVDSLYESSTKSRHYTRDVTNGQVKFGDGVRGMIPPKGERNVRAVMYRVGGGSAGNVAAASIVDVKQSLSYVEGVQNPFPAMGGADLESVDDVKLRGPAMLKSRGRAVTREDYEALAQQASNSVARVNCIPGWRSEGQVAVVIVPKVSEKHEDFMGKPVPTTELLRRVRKYLDDRKLLTTQLHVLKPRYRELSVRIEITRRPSGAGDRIKREIDERLRYYLHPLRGGKGQRGWPFGRNVFKVDLYHVVEEVEGVDFVSRVTIHDEEKKIDVEQIRILEHELPYLVNVDITEKAAEKII
ncbi:MAG: hypothetical protein ACI9OJ_001853 [Myxococcota bacterium]|jgi:hypothetical protein